MHGVYDVTQLFPKDELFGATSQLRRAALSVLLNYVEGYGRVGDRERARFLKIAYGSLKEAQCLIVFARERKWYRGEGQRLDNLADEIGKMLWSIFSRIGEV